MKLYFILIFALAGMSGFGRSRSEMDEWKSKGLPSDMRGGVLVEVYDLKKAGDDRIDLNIRLHNLSGKSVDEVSIKVWIWKDEGVYVEEIPLLGRDDFHKRYINSGREEFFPGRGSYYRLKRVKYSEMDRVQVKVSRVVSKSR